MLETAAVAEIFVDTYLCSGCATCVELAGDVFALDPVSDKAVVIDVDVEITEAVNQAIAFCPEKCIEILA